jgi:hypothetical protein
MSQFDFCGGTYQSISPSIDAQLAMNCYIEQGAPDSRSAQALLQTDGHTLFAKLPAGAGQADLGTFTYNGRSFTCGILLAFAQVHLYEILPNGTLKDWGSLGAPLSNAPAQWAANPNQLVFTVAGTGNIYAFGLATTSTLVAGTITTVTAATLGGSAFTVRYLQGFFVTVFANSNIIAVSNIEDGTTWPAINQAEISDFADNIIGFEITELTVWFMGTKQSVPYFNSGALFPLVPVPGALVEEGLASPFGLTKIDNTVLWVGANADQGAGMAWRMNGYTPQRISTHAVETAWQAYPTISDVITYAFQTRGHKFWHVYFPTANASWRYDIATGLWHQVGLWNAQTGTYGAHPSCSHTFNFGRHLIGDPFSGNIYAMAPKYPTFNGAIVRPCRRAPYIAKEHENLFHRKFEALCETGEVSVPAPSDAPVQLLLADPTGQAWIVEVNDNGQFAPSQYAPAGSVASAPILADNVNQSTFWQLAITTGGVVYGIAVNFGRVDVATLMMATNQSFLDAGLEVNQQGIVSITQPRQHLRAPQLDLRWADDGGKTWSNYYPESLGLVGETDKRVIWRRLGKSRNRVYETSCSDPIWLCIVNAFINDPGQAQERLSDQLRKMA